MRTTLVFLAFFLLACSGALNSMTPALPFDLPAETNTTNINIATNNGVNTTDVSFTTRSATVSELQADIEKQLAADGWTVTSADGMLTATKGGQQMVVSLSDVSGNTAFSVQWVH